MHGTGVSTVNCVHGPSRMGHATARRTVRLRSRALRGSPHTATAAPKSATSRPWTSGPRRCRTMCSPCAIHRAAPAALTHWSFEQLATIAGAPPKYLRTLPAPIASAAINHGLRRQRREQHQLFTDQAAPWTVHAITSPRYARVHHDELADRVLDLMASHPAWQLPLGYKDGVFGAERVPSGAYLGDRDMFLFLVDGNRDLDDPTDRSRSGLFRGFILRNSDVGAAALTLDVFLFRVVCGNHIIWGFQHVAGFRRRHVGTSIQDAWSGLAGERPRGPRRRPVRRPGDAPAGHLPGDRADPRRGARRGDAAARSAAEVSARRRTAWRSSTRRIRVRSGATCKD